MKKYMILLILLLFASPTSGQNPTPGQRHTTQQQCRADLAEWVPGGARPDGSRGWAARIDVSIEGSRVNFIDTESSTWGTSDFQEINYRMSTMVDCQEIDAQLKTQYQNAETFYWILIAGRLKDFILRNHSWEQFMQEDKEGKR